MALGVVLVLLLAGMLGRSELREAGSVSWRPLLTIASIMVMSAAVDRLGVLDRAAGLLHRASRSTARLFVTTFVLSAATSAVLNNDSAVLLLIPVVVPLVRRLHPDRPEVVAPFAFAVFLGAGVAPLVVSNPMNMIVAEYAGVGFNSYLLHMLPIAVVCWLVTFAVLWLLFRNRLGGAPETPVLATRAAWKPGQVHGLALLLGVLVAYPVVAAFGGPIWVVAAAGGACGMALCALHRRGTPRRIVAEGISWDILLFLACVSTAAIGIRDSAAVEPLATVYREGGLAAIGVGSALGSAVVNNHPMSLVNMLAIDAGPGRGLHVVLAALIGGDLGPRLLPAGSLAGLLWFESLRRLGVSVPLGRFVAVGAIAAAPCLLVSLLVLGLAF
jgi:arsenical pump membrane protein